MNIHWSLNVSVYMSSFTLTAIAVNRYQAVFNPFSALTKSRNKTALIILCLDFFAIIIQLDDPIFYNLIQDDNGNIQCIDKSFPLFEKYYDNITWYIVQNIIPFTIIAICYTRIMIRLKHREKSRRMSDSVTTQQIQEEAARNGRMNKMLISMVVIFGISWFPINLINLLI